MSDWNTLHLFNSKVFHSKIVPDLKGDGIILSKYFNSTLGRSILYDNSNSKERIDKIIAFCNDLDPQFKCHKAKYSLETRKRKISESYEDFRKNISEEEKDFEDKYNNVIDDLSMILPLIIFAECAIYNPHLILGRRTFSGCIHGKKGSIAENCCDKIICRDKGSLFISGSGGIINWLTNEDVQLLALDKDNLFADSDETNSYLIDFLNFLQLALENDYGFISVTNINESTIQMIEKPKFSIEVDMVKMGFESVIWTKY
jgi:hypothetical protein